MTLSSSLIRHLSLFDNCHIGHTPVIRSADRREVLHSICGVISQADFRDAISNIILWPDYQVTPLLSLDSLASSISVNQVLYKDESSRFGLGSFKALGGAYATQCLLSEVLSSRLGRSVSLGDILLRRYLAEVSDIMIVCATDGNHGRSVAWASRSFGAGCSIVLHRHVSKSREEAISEFGADIIRIQGDYDESVRFAQELADKNGWLVVSDTSYEGYVDIPKWIGAGYGVLADEIIFQLSQSRFDIPTHIFLQAGVGGFAASISAFLSQHWYDLGSNSFPRVIVVESDRASCLSESAKLGKPSGVAIHDETIMAGLSCGETSLIAWEVLSNLASDVVTIPDSLVAPTMQLLAGAVDSDLVIEAGESSVAGLAALLGIIADPSLAKTLKIDHNSRILVIGTEGATDPEVYEAIMKQNLFSKQQ